MDDFEAAEIILLDQGAVGEEQNDGRNEQRDGGAILLHFLAKCPHVESREDHDGHADHERVVQELDETVDVAEGQNADLKVVLGECAVVSDEQLGQTGGDVGMGDFHGFGESRCARREADAG